jgi:hypothetical protein
VVKRLFSQELGLIGKRKQVFKPGSVFCCGGTITNPVFYVYSEKQSVFGELGSNEIASRKALSKSCFSISGLSLVAPGQVDTDTRIRHGHPGTLVQGISMGLF